MFTEWDGWKERKSLDLGGVVGRNEILGSCTVFCWSQSLSFSIYKPLYLLQYSDKMQCYSTVLYMPESIYF